MRFFTSRPRMRRAAARRQRPSGPANASPRMISSWRRTSRPPSRITPPDAFPDRRQLADVPRVSRVSRQRTVEPGRAHDARGVCLRDDAAEADCRITSRATSAASFDLARPDVSRSDLRTTTRRNRAAMPDDLAEQINWVHQACEAMGVPIVTAAGYEADDVIGTLAKQRGGRRVRGRDRLDRQGLLPAGRRRHPRLRPARGWRVVRRRRRRREVRRAAGAGGRRARRSSATPATTSPACPASARRARSI